VPNKYRKGLSLIELLIVLGLIGIIIALAFSLDLFAIKTLAIGDKNAQLQHNIRLASDYITKELRTAYSINVYESMPTIDTERRYFYIEGNTIKHYKSGAVKDIMMGPPSEMVPELIFEINADNDKIIKYIVSGTYKLKTFSLTSEVYPTNLIETDAINIINGNKVVEYSSPLSKDEIVDIDSMLLDLKKQNHFLVVEANGSLTAPPAPNPDSMFLPTYGPNGSIITWTSDNSAITPEGSIIRPGIDAGNISDIKITATLTFSDAISSKIFILNVQDMDDLELSASVLPLPNATLDTSYNYSLAAIGGSGVYSFYSENIDALGLALDSFGRITGIPTITGNNTFSIIISDSYGNSTPEIDIDISINE
jgi:prepilin-type N-terminal cleavage/methylation domain-containing protein